MNLNYLKRYNLSNGKIDYIKSVLNLEVINNLINMKDVIIENLDFLKEFGIEDFTELIINRPDLLLLTTSKLEQKLSKLDRDFLLHIFNKSIGDLVNFNI